MARPKSDIAPRILSAARALLQFPQGTGKVGAIGGIAQKMAGARADGATVFLVPASNCSEALRAVPDGLRLVKVTDVDDAMLPEPERTNIAPAFMVVAPV